MKLEVKEEIYDENNSEYDSPRLKHKYDKNESDKNESDEEDDEYFITPIKKKQLDAKKLQGCEIQFKFLKAKIILRNEKTLDSLF